MEILEYKNGKKKKPNSFWSPKARAHVLERREEQGRGRRGRRRRRRRSPKMRYVFALESWVFGFLRFGMENSWSLV